jgi:hypothetical protein
MIISTPLGARYDVDRNVNTAFCRWEDELYCRERTEEGAEIITQFRRRKGDTGFFSFSDTVESTSPRAVPISCQFIDSDKI